MKASTSAILESLEPLFALAESDGLWFYSSYQQLWFSPEQLRREHANGRFIWSPCNWTLRSPDERRQELIRDAVNADERLREFDKRAT